MKKWLKRIFWGFTAVLLLILLYAGGVILYEGWFGESSAQWTNVSFTDADGTELRGYLAQPEEPGVYPGVLLIHEWWGFNEGMTVLADALATEGYVVLAADAYRGEVTDQVPRALYLRLSTPEEQVFNDVDAALAYLMSLDAVDTKRLASMGFCFGGGHSLQLGMRQSENMALTILYYGAVVTDPDLLRPLTEGQGVLGVFGEEDASIPTADVLEFEAALNSLEIPNQITIYPGVGHAFLTEENFDEPGTAGEAWRQTLDFLAENFKNE
ncbi:MAG: dienelactone hydrolase family protein [Chloroflexota bacterium]